MVKMCVYILQINILTFNVDIFISTVNKPGRLEASDAEAVAVTGSGAEAVAVVRGGAEAVDVARGVAGAVALAVTGVGAGAVALAEAVVGFPLCFLARYCCSLCIFVFFLHSCCRMNAAYPSALLSHTSLQVFFGCLPKPTRLLSSSLC